MKYALESQRVDEFQLIAKLIYLEVQTAYKVYSYKNQNFLKRHKRTCKFCNWKK